MRVVHEVVGGKSYLPAGIILFIISALECLLAWGTYLVFTSVTPDKFISLVALIIFLMIFNFSFFNDSHWFKPDENTRVRHVVREGLR